MIFIVLGMHKSGTTLIAETLHQSGINMGNFPLSIDYDQGNKFERHESQDINRNLLSGHLIPKAKHLLSIARNPKFNSSGYRFNSDSTAIFIRKKNLKHKLDHGNIPHEVSDLIEQSNSQHENWGFKDPRTCLTYALWKRAIPEHKIIVVYRNYENLLRRFNPPNSLEKFRIINSWRYHNEAILENLSTTTLPYLILEYDELMNDDTEYSRLQSFVGLNLTDARKENYYRNKSDATDVQTNSSEFRLLTRLREFRSINTTMLNTSA